MRTLALILGFFLNLTLWAGAWELGQLDGLRTVALLAVLNFLAIFCHELGHAWAFRHVGGTVSKIVVLFLSFEPKRGLLRWHRGRSNGDVGGFVAGRYRPQGPTVRDRLIVAGAGPGANVLTGGAALGLAELWGAPQRFVDLTSAETIIAGSPSLQSGPAMLPSDSDVAATLERIDAAAQSFALHQFSYTALILFGTLSVGIALLNLFPYAGSDGQAIARALRFRAAMSRRS